ncbi:MAG: hypothetical protein KGL39_56540 [Patescibacteria group bacterium]|nr:hypothetical protein [Patescibacteria group bacterium]
MSAIDLSPIIQAVATLLLAAITTAVGYATPAVLKRLGVANSADLAAKINTAADAAAGEAYRQAVLHSHDLTIPAGHNAAVAVAANYLLSRLPDTLKEAGVTPEAVDGLVAARIGKLLAADPTISTARPAAHALLPAPAVEAPTTQGQPT